MIQETIVKQFETEEEIYDWLENADMKKVIAEVRAKYGFSTTGSINWKDKTLIVIPTKDLAQWAKENEEIIEDKSLNYINTYLKFKEYGNSTN